MEQPHTFNLVRWRLIAAVLVALGLVLPLSTCAKGDPPVTEYHYALGDAVNNPSCEGPCRVGAVGVSLATFLWPLAAGLAAIRFAGPTATLVRLGLEPLLLGGAAWWLYWQLLFRDPAIGSIVAILGLVLYAVIWCLECARVVRARTATSAAQASPRRVGLRMVLLVACVGAGLAVGFVGQALTASDAWFLAVPLLVAIVWFAIADPTDCSCSKPPRH